MPKGKQRPKRDVPIKARYNFCIHCLRHVNNNFDPKEDTVYNISCLLNARASIICRFCADGNKTCDPPVTGLLGNTRDLVKIIEWAAAILDEDYWNSDVKQTINEKVHVLSKIFDSVEGAHARKFSLKGTKTAKHKFTGEYIKFIESRHTLLTQSVPHPGLQSSLEDRRAYEAETLLRLLPGDPGYVGWLPSPYQRVHQFSELYTPQKADKKDCFCFSSLLMSTYIFYVNDDARHHHMIPLL